MSSQSLREIFSHLSAIDCKLTGDETEDRSFFDLCVETAGISTGKVSSKQEYALGDSLIRVCKGIFR